MQVLIDEGIRKEVLAKLDELAKQHQVTIISAIESGSRAWGFPSPDRMETANEDKTRAIPRKYF